MPINLKPYTWPIHLIASASRCHETNPTKETTQSEASRTSHETNLSYNSYPSDKAATSKLSQKIGRGKNALITPN